MLGARCVVLTQRGCSVRAYMHDGVCERDSERRILNVYTLFVFLECLCM